MTIVETLQAPQTKRLTKSFAPQRQSETDKDMPQEWHDQYCRDCRNCHNCSVYRDCYDLIEGQKQDGVPDAEILTMAQVVAICKEVRAEIYAEDQALANSR